jgi:predicted enzyme related to lactoylglutathione lyase
MRGDIVVKKSSHVIRIPHITIPVSDLKKAMSFYESILGLEKKSEWTNYAIFDVGGVELALGAEKLEIYLLVDNVDKAYQDFKEKGVKFVTEPKDQPWGARAATIVDPDGNMFIIESFKCKVCGKPCQSYLELVEHMEKRKEHVKG